MGPVELHASVRRRLVPGACVLVAALTGGHGPAMAMQVLDASDGASIEAILSIQEPTRIRIDGTVITEVFGNIHSSGCAAEAVKTALPPALPIGTVTAGAAGATAVAGAANGLPPSPWASGSLINPMGELVIECDREKGEIYVRPIGEGKKPINLFVASAHGTYTLLLRPADTPADTIVIRDKAALQRRAEASAPALPPGTAASHVRGLKALLVAMASNRLARDIQVEDHAQPIILWREALFTLQRTYRVRGLIGERYRLQNVSDAPLVLAEQEFDHPDDSGSSVAAVAIEHHNLRPGDSTLVFVIRREVQP
ncbi:type-F conjugative transfer system secretin TraK [Roseateles flavus]|uniref:Type-F conjugative transfer system secretin TraK n=1 Tax=Roseateles flavus TaxID=3149041 RepID=A0ABV0GKQ4_9BURK